MEVESCNLCECYKEREKYFKEYFESRGYHNVKVEPRDLQFQGIYPSITVRFVITSDDKKHGDGFKMKRRWKNQVYYEGMRGYTALFCQFCGKPMVKEKGKHDEDVNPAHAGD